MSSIKNLSPHYINIPFVSPRTGLTCTKYRFELFVWTGLKTSSPIEPHFTITKDNIEDSTGNDEINISRLIKDFINFTPQTTQGPTQLLDGNNQSWVKTQVFYTTSDSSELEVPQLLDVLIMSKGFGYGMDGENPRFDNLEILIPNVSSGVDTTYKIDKNAGRFIVPIVLPEKTSDVDAVDDTFNIFFQDTLIDVLANDNLGFTPTVIYSFDDSSFGATDGFLSIQGNILKYNVGSVLNTPLTATYTIKDSIADQDTATIIINIDVQPSVLTAVNDIFNENDTDQVNLMVLANDFLGTLPTDIITVVQTGITSGALTISGDKQFIIFTPNGITPSSSEMFTYTIEDNTASTDTATVTLTVTSVPGGGSSVNMSIPGATIADDSCSLFPAVIRYYDGSFTLPTLQDTIYTDVGLTTIFNGSNEYFKLNSDNVIRVNNSGVVTSSGRCIFGVFHPF